MNLSDWFHGIPDVKSIRRIRHLSQTNRFPLAVEGVIDRHLKRQKPGLYRRNFPKRIPEVITEDLERAVGALTEKEPRIEEIWLFGSYARGTFDRRESDIDLAVFVNAPEYFYTEKTHWIDYYGDGAEKITFKFPSNTVTELIGIIENKVRFPGIYSVHIITNGDNPYRESYIRAEDFLRSIRQGKLLYPTRD